MRQVHVRPRWRQICISIAALTVALLLSLGAHPAAAKSQPSISLKPTSGSVNTQVTIAGKNFPTFCIGIIQIDNESTTTTYTCDSHGSFQTTIAWPDGLNDGKHTIMAQGAFGSSAKATFTQISATPTPDAGATATVVAGATATASTAQATATAIAQATVTAQQATATAVAAAGAGAGGSTTPGASSGVPGSLLIVLFIAIALLIAGGLLLVLALNSRHHPITARSAHGYRPIPPPPPPPLPGDATMPPGEPWVWPNDPNQR